MADEVVSAAKDASADEQPKRAPVIAAPLLAALLLAAALLERRGVHQAALGPEPVEAPLKLQGARLAHVALEDLAIIAADLDGLRQPFVVQAEPRAELAGRPEQALDGRRARLGHLIDIGLRDAELLGLDQAVMQPGDDVGPYFIAIARERSERLLADGL